MHSPDFMYHVNRNKEAWIALGKDQARCKTLAEDVEHEASLHRKRKTLHDTSKTKSEMFRRATIENVHDQQSRRLSKAHSEF